MKLINIGFGSMIAANRLLAIVAPDSAPIKRVVQEARDRGMLIDASYGHKTQSVILMDTDHVILSALTPETVSERWKGKEEKEETERMFASLKAEIAQLKKIRKDKSIDKDIIASVEQRLNVLNMFILAELSDSFEKIAYAELGKLMEDREGFLESTRKTFMVSHPKFMSYLQKKNLTEWEIGCCCLYCIGFNGAELSEYLNRKAIYNVNSIIRQKLDIPKGGTQIDVFLKQKMQEFHS